MIIDLHSHLLPGVDDGAQTIEQSLELARIGESEGVEHLVLTPHHRNGQYNNYKNDVIKATEKLKQIYQQAGINMEIYPAQEIRLTEHFLDDLYNDDLLSLDIGGKYYLIEFPSNQVPVFAKDLIQDLISQGITPVIAHPERNHKLIDDLGLLYELVEMGCLSQVTTSSLSGYYGEKLQDNSRRILELNLAHIIASDVHHIKNRPFNIQTSFDLLKQEYGQEMVNYLQENARHIFNGDVTKKAPPINPVSVKKKWFDFFKR